MTPRTANPPRRSIGFLFGMCSFILGANLVWVSYNTTLLPTLVEGIVTESRGLVVGLIGFFGAMLAVIVSILWGIISDHSSSRWGKRTPSILVGTLAALPLIGLPSLILSPSLRESLFPAALPIIVISYLGMQFFTNVANGAWWPLLVDVVPENQRGLASGFQGFQTLLGAALGILVVTGLNQNGQTGRALWLVGALYVLTGLVNVLVIRGRDVPAAISQPIHVGRAMGELFKVRTRVSIFFWLVLAVMLANMGINSLQFFARYFFEVYFPAISPDAAFRTMGGISLVVTMLAAVGAGFLSDKIGRRALILWGMVGCAVMTLLMGVTSNYTLFLVFTTVRSIAMGPIMATAPALASDLSPRDEAGRYMAYNNLTTGLSAAISSLVFGLMLADLTRISFRYLFFVSAILFLAGGILFALKVSQKELDGFFAGEVEPIGEAA